MRWVHGQQACVAHGGCVVLTLCSLLDIASSSKALRWRHAGKEQVPKLKFATIFYSREWERALQDCSAAFRPALCALRQLIFKSSEQEYLQGCVTAEEFAGTVLDAAAELPGLP